MNLNKLKHFVLRSPAGDDGADAGGGPLDRGDDLDLKEPETQQELKDPFKDEKEEGEEPKDEKEEGEEPKDEDKPKKVSKIPLDRHKEILAKERAQREALERELAQYRQGQQVAQTNEEITKMEDMILQMEKQYNKLLAEGEVDKAAELMSKIRRAEREIVELKADMRAQAAEIRAREAARYDITLERIEEAYPQLNPDSDEFDRDLVQDVADLKDVYQRRGNPPYRALQMAVKKLLGSETRTQETATQVTPRVTEKDVAAQRKKEAVARNVDAAKRTPPSTRDIGMDHDKAGGGLSPKDVMNMSQEEFAKLTEEQLKKLRGDTL